MKINLKFPTVGPIVGYTNGISSRIWFRGDMDVKDNTACQRCFGAVIFRKKGTKGWLNPIINKMSPNFDMTAVFVLSGLEPETDYEYKTGWFFADADYENLSKIPSDLFKWHKDSWVFRSGSSNPSASRSYVVGSCRYLLRLFGLDIFDDRGDKVFRSILGQINNGRRVDALLMIGDQIYADDLYFLSSDTRFSQFVKRYQNVFSQPYIRELMACTPTYMILDDHEIENNWPANASPADRFTLYPHAIHSYQIYQSSHSPLFNVSATGRIEGTPSHFWYSFTDGCADWFVTDSRTERIVVGDRKRMLKDEQLQALFKWLDEDSGKVKFIVTSVILFPDVSSNRDDSWGAYPEQREQILDHIRIKNIQKVIFISGDMHCSFTAELRIDFNADFLIHQVVSSSFFWPYPHMEKGDVIEDKLITGAQAPYKAKLSSPIHTTDNFVRLDVSSDTVTVSFFERKGTQLGAPVLLVF